MARCASHESDPSSVPQGIVESYSTLPWVMWEVVTVAEGIPWWGLLGHMLATGALVYPSQGGRYCAKGCMALGSAWGSVDGDLTFFPNCRRAPFWGLRQTYVNERMNEWINRPMALVMEYPCPRDVRKHGGGSLTGDSEGKIKRYTLRET